MVVIFRIKNFDNYSLLGSVGDILQNNMLPVDYAKSRPSNQHITSLEYDMIRRLQNGYCCSFAIFNFVLLVYKIIYIDNINIIMSVNY